MQLLFIFGIVFAITAVTFALQNNVSVTVAVGFWTYSSSLAVVLLVAIGIGALVTGLISTPSMLKAQWDRARLRRQLSSIEEEKASLENRLRLLEARVAPAIPGVPPETGGKPYVGLKSLMTGTRDPV